MFSTTTFYSVLRNSTKLLLAAGLVLTVACSKDDDSGNGNNNPNNDHGEASFDISGSVQGQKEGRADVVFSDVSGTHMMAISIYDGAEGNQTFSLGFSQGPADDPLDVPDPGTYEIEGYPTGNETDKFSVLYTNTDNQEEFGSVGGATGTMVVTESNQTSMKGTFEFSAASMSTGDSVIVKNGEFTAVVQN